MKLFILMTVFFSHLSFGAIIEDERGKVQVDLPSGWTYEKNLLGLPHVFLSSEKPEKTSVSLTLTGQEGVKLKVEDLKKNQSQYQDGRKTWAEDRKAKIVKFIPYESMKFKTQIGHSIGFIYEMNGKTYQEMSYYIECPQSFIHMKVLGIQNASGFNEGVGLVKSLNCQ